MRRLMSVGSIFLAIITILSFWVLPGYAQNYGAATEVPTETEEMEEDLTDAQIQAVLMEQGIPTAVAQVPIIETASNYSLGATDIIEIVVLRHPEVSGQYIVNNEGNIQYEFIGDLNVTGKTKKEVAGLLTEKLSEYIISPEVNVKILGYNSKIVYVIGEVGNPGKIFMRGDTITVREALVQAGLPLLTGKLTKSVVITSAVDGKAKVRKVNVHKLLYKGDLREDLVMAPGDTLFVPPTGMAKVMRTIQPVATPIGTAAGTGASVGAFAN